MLRAAFQLTALASLAAMYLAGAGSAQSQSSTQFPAPNESQVPTALVRSVKVAPPTEAAAVEIITTRPMIPAITVLQNPPRLVIDLPKALVTAAERIASHSQPIRGVRVHQFQKNPPSVRVVVDLAEPAGYSWDEAGNRLMIRLRPPGKESSAATTPPAAVKPVAEASARAGSVVLASRRTVIGSPGVASTIIPSSVIPSSISAGAAATVLPLERGGEVRVCPGTTISVSASQTSRDMMLGMSTGAIEAHYGSQSAADSVLTPDFRIVPSGAGQFDYAISADSRGNTCVRSLPGNTASATVSELMGGGSYRVKPSGQVVFHGGSLAEVDAAVPADCGCSSSAIPVMRASSATAPAVLSPSRSQTQPGGEIPRSSSTPETASLPPTKPNDIHVQIDAPFVFRASETQPATPQEIAQLPVTESEPPNLLNVIVLPPKGAAPAAAVQPQQRGFLGKVKSFFAGIFR